MKVRRRPRRAPALLVHSIARLRLEPGDVLVVHIPNRVTADGRANIAQSLRQLLDNAGHEYQPVLFAPEDMRFGLLSPSQPAPGGSRQSNEANS